METITVGAKTPMPDVEVQYEPETNAYLLVRDGKVVRVLVGVYSVEVG